MPQSPLNLSSVNSSGAYAPTQVDSQSALRTTPAPKLSSLGITAATVAKAGPGRITRINVIVPGSTAGGVYDCLTTAAAASSNQIASIPPLTTAQLGSLSLDVNALTGITILPGTGQTLAAFYE